MSDMPLDRETTPPAVYLIADHLDAALAAGEDLVAAGRTWPLGDCSDPCVAGGRRFTLSRIKTHEASLIGRIVQSRGHVEDLARAAPRFRALAQLFVVTTRDLVDALNDLGETSSAAFDNGDSITAYVRSRGLIDVEAPGLKPDEPIVVGDEFIVAGRMRLGVVLDLVAEFLDALDVAFDLYPENAAAAVQVSAAIRHAAAQPVTASADDSDIVAALAAAKAAAAAETASEKKPPPSSRRPDRGQSSESMMARRTSPAGRHR